MTFFCGDVPDTFSQKCTPDIHNITSHHTFTPLKNLMAASIADGTQVYDDLLQRFIVTGYVVLPPNPSVPASVHADIASSVLACGFQASGRRTPYGLAMLDGDAAGNNLLHAAPALRGEPCLASPALHSALGT